MEPINSKTGMTHTESREFIRNHFEEFVNRKNVNIGNVNFASDFVDNGADVPPGTPPDKVVVCNQWTATDSQTGNRLEFRAIVIWRIAARKIAERWAYLEAPHPAS